MVEELRRRLKYLESIMIKSDDLEIDTFNSRFVDGYLAGFEHVIKILETKEGGK